MDSIQSSEIKFEVLRKIGRKLWAQNLGSHSKEIHVSSLSIAFPSVSQRIPNASHERQESLNFQVWPFLSPVLGRIRPESTEIVGKTKRPCADRMLEPRFAAYCKRQLG